MTGWDVDFLQNAVETCTNLSGEISDCPLFSLQPDSSATTCSAPVPSPLKNDDCAGPRDGICGNVPIQSGPAYATTFGSSPSQAPVPFPPSLPKPSLPQLSLPLPTPASSTNVESLLPTSLGYSKGTSVATDNSGGGITIAQAPNEAAPAAATTTVVLEASGPAAPAVTPSPELNAAPADPGNIVRTSSWTSDGKVYQLYIDEVDTVTTVTVDAPPSKKRRHIHHRRGHHGGLGQGPMFHG